MTRCWVRDRWQALPVALRVTVGVALLALGGLCVHFRPHAGPPDVPAPERAAECQARLAELIARALPQALPLARQTPLDATGRQTSITGPCAPLRLALALAEGLRAAPADGTALRWTDAGALELVAPHGASHAFQFPGREGELADLARPFPKAALVIVMDDMGQSLEAARDLAALPFPVALAILPHTPHLKATAALAQRHRLDTLLHQPMEPLPRPGGRPDPGPGALPADEAAMRQVLDANLAALPTALGLNNHMGSAFTGDATRCETLCRQLPGRGVAVLDSVTQGHSLLAQTARDAGLVALARHVFLDVAQEKAAVLAALDKAAHAARRQGYAIAIGHPLPNTLRALRQWENREGVAVVPLRRLIWHVAQEPRR